VLGAIRDGATIELDGGRLVGTPTTAAPDILERVEGDASTELTAGYRPNTTVLIGERVVLKLMREPQTDGCAELEISRYLTERTAFSNFPRLAGDLTLADGEAQTVLLLAVEYRRNQGDAWRYVRHHLDRFLDEARLRPPAETREALDQIHADSLALMATLGHRLGELHLALAGADGDLAPLPIARDEPAQWKARLRRRVDDSLAAFARRVDDRPAAERGLAAAADRLRARIDALAVEGYRGLRCRYHGDLHLGRVLLAEGDVIITGFSAEPALARIGADARQSPLRDLAELLRSIDWAVQASLRAFREASLGDIETLRGLAADWQRRARRALLDAWFDAVADSPLDAAGRPETEALIELFVLEKLLREIRHGRRGDDPSLAVNGLLEHLAGAAAT
jgi:maltose alpha-D-glucosyltransferase/alpha-amylase